MIQYFPLFSCCRVHLLLCHIYIHKYICFTCVVLSLSLYRFAAPKCVIPSRALRSTYATRGGFSRVMCLKVPCARDGSCASVVQEQQRRRSTARLPMVVQVTLRERRIEREVCLMQFLTLNPRSQEPHDMCYFRCKVQSLVSSASSSSSVSLISAAHRAYA